MSDYQRHLDSASFGCGAIATLLKKGDLATAQHYAKELCAHIAAARAARTRPLKPLHKHPLTRRVGLVFVDKSGNRSKSHDV